MPERLGALLDLVRVLLGYGRRLAATTPEQAASPRFSTIAGVAGTHDLSVILARVTRGVMRLMALDIYLLSRAVKGREIAVTPPRIRTPAPEPDPAKKPRPRRAAYDPDSFHIPSFEDLEKEVRRTPVGRTIARVCLDLAVIPSFCTGEIWNRILDTLQHHGGSLGVLYRVRRARDDAFQRERDKHPNTWGWDWRDGRKPTIRQVLGSLIGEAPSVDPPPANPPPDASPVPA